MKPPTPQVNVIHRCQETGNPWEHYVGRPSPLGNPFKIGRDGNREQVIEKYRKWLKNNRHTPEVMGEILRILVIMLNNNGRVDLSCWCKPQACHADVIKEDVLGAYNSIVLC